MAVDLMSSTLASSIVRAAPRWLDRRDVPAPVDAAPRTAATDAAGPPVRPRHVPAAAPTRSPATRRSATRFLRPTSTPTESFSPPQATAWLEPAPKAAAPSAAPAIGAARPWWAALLPRLWPQRASWRALDWRGLRGLGSRRPAAALAPPRLNQASSVRTPAPSTAPSPARTRSDLYDHVPAHSGSPSIATRRAAPPVQPAEAYSADLAAAFAPSDAAFTPDRDARAALRRHSAESQPTPVRPHPGSFTNPVSQRGLGRPMYSPKFATAAPARATPVDTVHRWPELPPWPADPVRDDASAPWAADRLRRLEAEQRG